MIKMIQHILNTWITVEEDGAVRNCKYLCSTMNTIRIRLFDMKHSDPIVARLLKQTLIAAGSE